MALRIALLNFMPSEGGSASSGLPLSVTSKGSWSFLLVLEGDENLVQVYLVAEEAYLHAHLASR